MRITTFAAIAILASLFIISCAPKPDMTALRKTVDEYNAASVAAMKGGDGDKVMAYYDENAMEMAPNAPVIKGKAAIKKFQDDMMKSGMKISSMEFTVVDLQAGGDIAVEIGTYDMTATMAPIGEIKDKGKYIATWKHQADGSWKVYAETWNTDTPMPMPEASSKTAKKKK